MDDNIISYHPLLTFVENISGRYTPPQSEWIHVLIRDNKHARKTKTPQPFWTINWTSKRWNAVAAKARPVKHTTYNNSSITSANIPTRLQNSDSLDVSCRLASWL